MLGVVILLLLLVYVLYTNVTRPSRYPPGPKYWPIVGNLISVWLKLRTLKCHHVVWSYWLRQYGDIIGLKLGNVNVVVVSGEKLIREVLTRQVFDGRPDGIFYTARSFGKKLGIVFSDGRSWQTLRRIVFKYLKHFGYNSQVMEKIITKECQVLVSQMEASAGRPIHINDMFNIHVINMLWCLVAGRRYDTDDERLKEICDLITRTFKTADMSGGVLNFMPFLRHVIPNAIGYTEMMRIHKSLYNFIGEVIELHKMSLDPKNPRDVIDALLIEIVECREEACSEQELKVVCLDLLEGGFETVTNTLVFMLLHLVLKPEVQRRVQEEIDRVIGSGRPPSLSDRTGMAYTEAVVLETLRISSIAPVGIPHMASDDAELGNYIIPKGTTVLLALYDLHNEKNWKEPRVFKPERFLNANGALIQNDCFIPFGLGRRRCMGELLARSELFLFLTHLMQKFHILIPEGEPAPSPDPINGVSLSAMPFKAIFHPRK
ncbi:Farnesoate epoxidase [Eumeta japonica]|uniref:Farnesoate epoxidase n=1 Tax=Eumeta variegata TaxID=151549 RepID=A0A4C1VRN6_EUMVA|nr:Farnesoate epoxidase [Eumeta japonica]